MADIYFTEFNRLFYHYFRAVHQKTAGLKKAAPGESLFLKEKPAEWLAAYKPGTLRFKRVKMFADMSGFTQLYVMRSPTGGRSNSDHIERSLKVARVPERAVAPGRGPKLSSLGGDPRRAHDPHPSAGSRRRGTSGARVEGPRRGGRAESPVPSVKQTPGSARPSR